MHQTTKQYTCPCNGSQSHLPHCGLVRPAPAICNQITVWLSHLPPTAPTRHHNNNLLPIPGAILPTAPPSRRTLMLTLGIPGFFSLVIWDSHFGILGLTFLGKNSSFQVTLRPSPLLCDCCSPPCQVFSFYVTVVLKSSWPEPPQPCPAEPPHANLPCRPT